MQQEHDIYADAARQAVELGNRLADANPEADVREIGDGLLAGAVHYWLYANQPCGAVDCEDCAPISTAEARVAELKRLIDEAAKASDYYHTPNDANAGRA